MNALPPPTPPAHVTVFQQAAIDAIERLRQTQSWLTTQQDHLPEPSVADARGKHLSTRLSIFWDTPVPMPFGEMRASRRKVLGQLLERIARDDASLRAGDGTLPMDARNAIHDLIRAGDAPPDHLHAAVLTIDDSEYAGSLILRDDLHPHQVMFFTSQGGWETFPSIDELYRDIGHRMKESSTPDEAWQPTQVEKRHDAGNDRFFGMRALGGRAFEAVADQLIEHHHRKTMTAMEISDELLRSDALYDALDLHALIDVHGIVSQRDAALLRHDRDVVLAAYPAALADAWRDASADYIAAQRRSDDAMNSASATSPLSLMEFTRSVLATKLKSLGIGDAPEMIHVRRKSMPGGPVDVLSTPREPSSLDDTNLLQLAFDNLPGLPLDDLWLGDASGIAHPLLTPAMTRQLIREMDAGSAYLRYIDSILGDTAQGRRHRQLASEHLLARMRLDAATARLTGHDAQSTASSDPAPSEAALRRVDAVLDRATPPSHARLDHAQSNVLQLTYRGSAVSGLLLITTGTQDIVAYTPGAPDGRVFRAFTSREDLVEQFLHQPRFESYLVERLPASMAVRDSNGSTRFAVSRASRTWRWVAGGTGHEFCTELQEAFGYRDVTDTFPDAVYDTARELVRLDTAYLTRTTSHADWRTVSLILAPFGASGERMVQLGLAPLQSIPHLAQAAWRAYDDIKAGDYTQSFLSGVDGYVAALNVIPLHGVASRPLASQVLRRSRHAPASAPWSSATHRTR